MTNIELSIFIEANYPANKMSIAQRNLGRFSTPKAAHDTWLKYKLSLADQLKPEMDAIDQRIYPNVVTIIKALS